MKEEITLIQNSIEQGIRLPHQAASIACDLYFVRQLNLNQEDAERLSDLDNRFDTIISENGMKSTLVDTRMDYAIRIAGDIGSIEYEELHKLFSLCDQIYILIKMNFPYSEELKIHFTHHVQSRLEKESKKAKMVADDKFEEWKSDLWWYDLKK